MEKMAVCLNNFVCNLLVTANLMLQKTGDFLKIFFGRGRECVYDTYGDIGFNRSSVYSNSGKAEILVVEVLGGLLWRQIALENCF